jgi:hypothetical protein
MDHGYFSNQQALGMPLESYQFYYDYESWSVNNQNYYSSVPAYQELNRPKFVQGFVAESIDLTDTAESQPTSSPSPTQARDFKLICERCKQSFTSKKRLENHMVKCIEKKNSKKMFSCRSCRKSFKKRSGLLKHETQNHDSIPKAISQGRIEPRDIEQPAVPMRSIFHSVHLLAISDCSNGIYSVV